MKLSEMSGLAHLEAIVSEAIPAPTIFKTMGMSELKVREGSVTINCQATKQHCNPMGGVHGGFAATVLDSVTGCAVHSELEKGVSYGTVDLTVKMMRPVPLNEPLVAEARVTHISRSIGIAEGVLKNSDGKLLASGYATCFIKR
ncbi:PaaI family thioesterase [Salinimonas sediminis]|uniref:PaaI family thioesterase n=1 Tax=Salinimonas sediminis TaxID=2303538 RepID=A0A346NJA8_9ALTE|nr:PaaI family thioesterase [Salinimonas sediminis]AXR05615.1 PaaI family thioesterase [Salinimonas sediminis]